MEKFKKLYSSDGIYGVESYGNPIVCRGVKFAAHIMQMYSSDYKKILCVGAGNGYEAVLFLKRGVDVTILEMYHPDIPFLKGRQVKGYAQDLPFEDKEFDLYFCCETMEHVPPELTVPILKEAKRVSKNVFFTIADREDPPYNTHINVHGLDYWYSMFKDLGFDIRNAQYAPDVFLGGRKGIIITTCPDGTLIHARC